MRKRPLAVGAFAIAQLLAFVVSPRTLCADAAQDAWTQGSDACARGDYDAAVRHFSEAVRLRPSDPSAYNNRAYVYFLKGDLKSAVADYDRTLQLDPKYAKALFFRGSAYEDTGHWDNAVADYTAAIRLDPRYARAYCDRGAKAARLMLEGRSRAAAGANPSHRGRSIFVASDGNDGNPGTVQRPLATLYKAHELVKPGDTVFLRGGTYQALINWSKSGLPDTPITIKAYEGEDVRLQSSEQYAWTHVADPKFGECWKAEIRPRPIRYPGVQATIGNDTDSGGEGAFGHIWAIVEGGYPCAPLHSADDFAKPQKAAGTPLTDRDGRLLYDVTWFDREKKTLWFKPGPSRVDNPDRQLHVTGWSAGQFSTDASYLRIMGLKFEYLACFHQQGKPTGCDISNCEIKHCVEGMVGGGARCTYVSLFIEKVGDWLTWLNDGYQRGNFNQCFYFNGTRCVVSNCFFARNNKASAIQNYPDGVAENLFDNNVFYHCLHGSIFMGSARNYVTNNISLGEVWGMGPWGGMQGFRFLHNYSEAKNPLYFAAHAPNGVYDGTFERFVIADNVLNNRGGICDYVGDIVDGWTSRVDGNVYLGDLRWSLGFTQEKPPRRETPREFRSFDDYTSALRAMPGCQQWERNSRAADGGPRFDFAPLDTLLDSNPPLAVPLRKARQYAHSVCAPYGGAGPTIDADEIK